MPAHVQRSLYLTKKAFWPFSIRVYPRKSAAVFPYFCGNGRLANLQSTFQRLTISATFLEKWF